MNVLKTIDRYLMKFLYACIQASVVVLLLLLAAQVAARYFRIQALAPQDEIINLFFAWFVFVGIALIFREDGHLRVEFVDSFIAKRPRVKSVYELFSILVRGAFIVVLISSSTNLFVTSGPRTSPMLSLPQRYWYASILFGACFMGVHCLVKIGIAISHLVKVFGPKKTTP